MSYKTVLVHVDESRNIETRINIAAQLVMADDGHLVGTAMTGLSHFYYESLSAGAMDPVILPHLDSFRLRAAQMLEKFEARVNDLGVSSHEKRLIDDEAAYGISLQARYCDLVVMGQHDPDSPAALAYVDVPEYVAMNSGCPSLIVPFAGTFENMTDRVLIAWNESMEASRAVRNALPLLRKAGQVDVVIFNADMESETYGQEPGAEIALYLARHGILVNVLQESTEIDVGNALLSLAANQGSTMLVMGCYGHTRFREVLLGGATRTVLKTMTIPVLMSH